MAEEYSPEPPEAASSSQELQADQTDRSGGASPAVDLDALARCVATLLKREMAIERERAGRGLRR
jgi:hypothetical protein